MATKVERTVAALEELIAELNAQDVEKLPPESELSSSLGVSRATLRDALASLEQAGSIRRQRRVGTTIVRAESPLASSADRAYPLDVISSFPEFFDTNSIPYEIAAVSVSTEACDAATALALSIPAGTGLYRVHRVFAVGGRRAIVAEHRLAQSLGGHPLQIQALTGGINAYLRETESIELTAVHSRISAVPADPHWARELDAHRGDPLLRVSLTLNTGTNGPTRTIAVGTLTINPAVIELSATATRPLVPLA